MVKRKKKHEPVQPYKLVRRPGQVYELNLRMHRKRRSKSFTGVSLLGIEDDGIPICIIGSKSPHDEPAITLPLELDRTKKRIAINGAWFPVRSVPPPDMTHLEDWLLTYVTLDVAVAMVQTCADLGWETALQPEEIFL